MPYFRIFVNFTSYFLQNTGFNLFQSMIFFSFFLIFKRTNLFVLYLISIELILNYEKCFLFSLNGSGEDQRYQKN